VFSRGSRISRLHHPCFIPSTFVAPRALRGFKPLVRPKAARGSRSLWGEGFYVATAAESFCIMRTKYHPSITIHGNWGTSCAFGKIVTSADELRIPRLR
jgi:hypothetical protein